jgi:hypothetical protein
MVPRASGLSATSLFGFFISPAIKVTLFHASLLKIEPTIAAAMAPRAAWLSGYAAVFIQLCRFQAFVQLAVHISGLNAKKPKPIRPKKTDQFGQGKGGLNKLTTFYTFCIDIGKEYNKHDRYYLSSAYFKRTSLDRESILSSLTRDIQISRKFRKCHTNGSYGTGLYNREKAPAV